MKVDRYGNWLSTGSQEAADAYVQGVDCFLSAQPGSVEAFQRAISSDPGFALAHAGLARALQSLVRMEEAATAMAQARQSAGTLTPREKAHVAIMGQLLNGNNTAAFDEICEHLKHYPRDALMVQPCCGVFGLIGFSGRRGREAEHLAFLTALGNDYGEDWWFDTQLAFAHCETGQLEQAERLIGRALEGNPANAHAAHYLAHILYEFGRGEEGKKFILSWVQDYHRRSLMHCHLNWHAALWELQAGDIDSAWRTIEQNVHPEAAWGPPINVLTDLVAFLLRAGFSGFPVPGDYWQDASDYASTHFGKPGVSFADAHAAIAHVMAGNDETLRRQQQNLDGPAMDQVKFVADAFSAFRDSRWQDAVDALAPVMSSHERLGGSRAQRDLLELAVATALRKLGKDDEANRLLSMRRPLLTQMIATPH